MKPITVAKIMSVLCLMSGPTAHAQFSSGSDGSYGPLNVTSNTTLDLPPDGKFHCTTITVASGATLTFRRNPLNTPVYLLATNDVTINGTINVSGKSGGFGAGGEGGPGGFDGGKPANGQGEIPGDGMGPGAGKGTALFRGGYGAYGTRNNPGGEIYGNSLILPLIGGSGGGGGVSTDGFGAGGGGGGAILIASNTKISVNGRIQSGGGDGGGSPYGGGSGSGGAVRIVGQEVRGGGEIDVRGLTSNGGGDGRIRVDGITRFALFLSLNGPSTIGKYMHVFPEVPARLDIIEAAGTTITEGNPGAVTVQLPLGSPTNQVVKVQARDFTGLVPITVAVTPDAGPGIRYDTQINMAGGNAAQTNVAVVIPVGTSCQIHAWTR